MADTGCAVQGFYNSSSDQEENSFPGPNESFTFGRFVSESLDWGRWSSFRQNKYLEEAEKFSKPGSVANMKAHFEAHFKKVAAMKAAAKAEQEKIRLASKELELENTKELNKSVEEDKVSDELISVSENQKLELEDTQELNKSVEEGMAADGLISVSENQGTNVDDDDQNRSSSKPIQELELEGNQILINASENQGTNVDDDDQNRRSSKPIQELELETNQILNKFEEEGKVADGLINASEDQVTNVEDDDHTRNSRNRIQKLELEDTQELHKSVEEDKVSDGLITVSENQGTSLNDYDHTRRSSKPILESSDVNPQISEEGDSLANGFTGSNENQGLDMHDADDDARRSNPLQEDSGVNQQISDEGDLVANGFMDRSSKPVQECSDFDPQISGEGDLISDEHTSINKIQRVNTDGDDDNTLGSCKLLQESSSVNRQNPSFMSNKQQSFEFGNENQGPNKDDHFCWRSRSHSIQKPLQENSSVNQQISSSTFKPKKWELFGHLSFSSISTNSGKEKHRPNHSKGQVGRSKFETPPSTEKSKPAHKDIFKTPNSLSPAISKTAHKDIFKTPNSQVPGMPSVSDLKRKGTPSHSGSTRTNVMSQSVSTSCWKSTTSIWKRPVRAVCSPFRLHSEERAEKRKEFYNQLGEKLKAEKLALDAKAKEAEEQELKKLRRNLDFKARPMPGFYRNINPEKDSKEGLVGAAQSSANEIRRDNPPVVSSKSCFPSLRSSSSLKGSSPFLGSGKKIKSKINY